MKYLIPLLLLSGCAFSIDGAHIDRLELRVTDFINGMPEAAPQRASKYEVTVDASDKPYQQETIIIEKERP